MSSLDQARVLTGPGRAQTDAHMATSINVTSIPAHAKPNPVDFVLVRDIYLTASSAGEMKL